MDVLQNADRLAAFSAAAGLTILVLALLFR
jgi:hypothetical protein